MTPQQCFGIIIRTVGLLLAMASIYCLVTAAYLMKLSIAMPFSLSPTYVTYGVLYGALGLYFLRGAPWLIRFCYPSSPQETKTPPL